MKWFNFHLITYAVAQFNLNYLLFSKSPILLSICMFGSVNIYSAEQWKNMTFHYWKKTETGKQNMFSVTPFFICNLFYRFIELFQKGRTTLLHSSKVNFENRDQKKYVGM